MALTPKQLKAIEMLIYTEKQKQQIAEELGVTPGAFSQWLKKSEFQEVLRQETIKGFEPLALKARRRLNLLIDSPNEQVALAASREALNKAGYGEVQKIEQTLAGNINIEIGE